MFGVLNCLVSKYWSTVGRREVNLCRLGVYRESRASNNSSLFICRQIVWKLRHASSSSTDYSKRDCRTEPELQIKKSFSSFLCSTGPSHRILSKCQCGFLKAPTGHSIANWSLKLDFFAFLLRPGLRLSPRRLFKVDRKCFPTLERTKLLN